MNARIEHIVVLSILLAGCACLADASSYVKVIEVPDVDISPGQNVSFPVILQNIGADYTYARLIFRGLPEGITVQNNTKSRFIYQGGKVTYQLFLVAEDVAAGEYNAEIGVAAKGSPSNYQPFLIRVSARSTSIAPPQPATPPSQAAEEESPLPQPASAVPSPETKTTPGPGFLLAAAAMLLARSRA
ncbi:MAG: hypothetical protein A4E47_00779 [Methanosaeta sp. PtaU1.Bin028]|nr:MAG: hypothetical protein A4E47_00779 [Methanosaeta sp. PtaU1.Bin028]